VKHVDFATFEEARIHAGLFNGRVKTELGISERTWYRWQRERRVPWWAYRLIQLLGGDLEHLGWPGWRLHRGVLTTETLSPVRHYWEPADLLVSVFCGCPAHQEVRRAKNARRACMTPANEERPSEGRTLAQAAKGPLVERGGAGGTGPKGPG
jgi:hypothetical protein